MLAQKKRKQAPRQSDALLFLLQNGETSLHDLVYFTGVSRQAVMKMVEGKTLSMREQEVFRVRLRAADETAPCGAAGGLRGHFAERTQRKSRCDAAAGRHGER